MVNFKIYIDNMESKKSFQEKVDLDIAAMRAMSEVNKESWASVKLFLHGLMIDGVKPFVFTDNSK